MVEEDKKIKSILSYLKTKPEKILISDKILYFTSSDMHQMIINILTELSNNYEHNSDKELVISFFAEQKSNQRSYKEKKIKKNGINLNLLLSMLN